MFDIQVVSLDQVPVIIETGWPTKIISLVKQDMPDYGPHHLHIKFDDICHPIDGHVHPERSHLLQILDFTKDLIEDDKVLVHCLAGISRSTAAAIAILIQHGMNYLDAYHQIELYSPYLSPNQLIANYIDKHFELNGEFYELVRKNEKFPNLAHRVMFDPTDYS